jgi:hypothetical protein
MTTIQQIRKDLTGIREATKPEVPNIVVLFYDRSGKVLRIAGIGISDTNRLDVASWTQEEIDEKIKDIPVIFLPEKEPYPGGTCNYPAN